MSLRGKDFRCEIDPELHERLRVMAEFHNAEGSISSFGARLLEKAIAGEWHEFSVLADRFRRTGIARKDSVQMSHSVGSDNKTGS